MKFPGRFIFLYPQGRLCNLLFQYQALVDLFSESALLISVDHYGLGKLILFPARVYFIKFGRIFTKLRFAELSKLIIYSLARIGLFSLLTERTLFVNNTPFETGLYDYRAGLLTSIVVVKGYFQSPEHSVNNVPTLRFPSKVVYGDYFQNVPYLRRVAIHLRFGDYATLNVLGKVDARLPLSYYNSAILTIKQRVVNPYFIVLSDDLSRAKSVLGSSDEFIYVNGGGEYNDFLILSGCSHAIISASSFSWWASYFISNQDKIIIAPKYWLGFKSKIWSPAKIQTNNFTYIEVNDE